MRRLSIATLAVLALTWTANVQTTAAQQERDRARQQNEQSTAKQNSSEQGAQANSNASASASANASAQAGPASLSSGTTVNAELESSVDARHVKPGQKVVARATQDVKQDGRVALRKGTKLIGHVTVAQARAKGQSESTLGIAFDRAVMKNGSETPFHAAIQALASGQTATSAEAEEMPMEASGRAATAGGGAMRSSGGVLGGAAGTVGNVAGGVGQTAGAAVNSTTQGVASATGQAGALNAAGQLTSTSTGVVGMRGLNLASSAANQTQGSLITSKTENVHLSSGTQMLLRVTGNQ